MATVKNWLSSPRSFRSQFLKSSTSTGVRSCLSFQAYRLLKPNSSSCKDVLVSKEDLSTASLKPMARPSMRIHLKDNAVPFVIHTPRQTPFAFRDQVKEELDSMVAQGIIKPTGDEPSDWCHPLIVVPKDVEVRITVDLTKLNSLVSLAYSIHCCT